MSEMRKKTSPVDRNEKLKRMEERSRRSLRQIQSLALETEKSAVDSLTELQMQRESLSKSQDTNRKTQEVIQEADTILERMSKWFGIW